MFTKTTIKKIVGITIVLFSSVVIADDSIKIGEINSFKKYPAFSLPYRKGMELAMYEINSSGGVLGKNLEIIFRDDNANPGDAVRAAEELVTNEGVVALTGTILSHVGLAVSDFANKQKIFFHASEPVTNKIVWQNGNHYTWRLRSSTYMMVRMLVPPAVKFNKKRWAIIYPNYEMGQSAISDFKKLLQKQQPDVEFVAEIATPLGKIDAASTVQTLARAKPDALFNVLFGTDLSKFVREANTRGILKDLPAVSFFTGDPEYLDPLGAEAPVGWVANGYPWYSIKTPEHDKFLKSYQNEFDDYPRLGSVLGYTTVYALKNAFVKAGSVDTEKLISAFAGLEVDTPVGKIIYREIDHQSTLGAYIGKIAIEKIKGKKRGRLVDYYFVDGKDVQPNDDFVNRTRIK